MTGMPPRAKQSVALLTVEAFTLHWLRACSYLDRVRIYSDPPSQPRLRGILLLSSDDVAAANYHVLANVRSFPRTNADCTAKDDKDDCDGYKKADGFAPRTEWAWNEDRTAWRCWTAAESARSSPSRAAGEQLAA